MNKIHRLSCVPNNYHWGKIGANSKVAQFMTSDESFTLNENNHYSELWMGTHPSGMSVLAEAPSKSLDHLISQDPVAYLGEKVATKYNNKLPFLFKVLSIQTALSIQAHPDINLAQKLHKERFEVYKDPNHKPEMSIALTDFEALSGFRPLEEISKFVDYFHPELTTLIGEQNAKDLKHAVSSNTAPPQDCKQVLKNCFSHYMLTDAATVTQQLANLFSRDIDSTSEFFEILNLARRLNTQYENDIGIFCIFFLNVIHLSPGESFFMGANEPHAYIYGDCIECMASSDNVVRAGLTPKYRDVEVLIDMLTYQYGPGKDKLTVGTPFKSFSSSTPSKYSTLYNPPIDEFSVLRTNLPTGNIEETVNINGGPAIVIIVNGSGSISCPSSAPLKLKSGYIFFVPNNVPFTLSSYDSDGLEAYTAFCHINSFHL
ncbi:Mannose-6-phosphate isomerase [Smittium mucronatum]|uniref:Mannose-6-phosphate isomerase n=1 Tax=Smittium mucronatum TaxID=133383 RepID=A0A1R0GQP6_9FUNG|nr:Mannose-6-phosphate isomerase [Smittium mucronatum]OLY81858.1 Mannose-6-phosphate isomerase [Smittium mucronatum]